MNSYSIFFKSLLISTMVFQFARASDLSIPSAIQLKIDNAIAVFPSKSVTGPAKNPAAARASLSGLAEMLTPQLVKAAKDKEGDTLNAKLIIIADALTREPARFDKIQRYYVSEGERNSLRERYGDNSGVQIAPVVITAPTLRPEHSTPDYRLVWEFFMLMTWFPAPEQFNNRVEEALIKIGDPRSVPVIEHRYRDAASDPWQKPDHFNSLLLEFPSERALRALLSCVEEWDEKAVVRRKKDPVSPIPGLSHTEVAGDPTAQIKTLQWLSPKKADAWREVAAKGRGATPEQRITLEKIRAALQSN
jgi:hypothetical protein